MTAFVDPFPRRVPPAFVRAQGDVMLPTRATLAPFNVGATLDDGGHWLLRRRALWLPLPASIPLIEHDPTDWHKCRAIGTFTRIEIDEEQDALVAFGSALAGALQHHLGKDGHAGIFPVFGVVGPPLGRFPYVAEEGGTGLYGASIGVALFPGRSTIQVGRWSDR